MHELRLIAAEFWRPTATPFYLVFAAVMTAGFAVVGRIVRGVTVSGAVAGFAVAFTLFVAAGPASFLALLAVFALTWAGTRFGYSRKRDLGTAERSDGRTASQVLANLSISALAAFLYAASDYSRLALLAASFAALAEAAADTVSSEVGQAAAARPRLITTWEQVPAGTDGGISLQGTAAGIVAAAIVSAIAFVAGLPAWGLVACVASATLGMMADSVLGAVLERRRVINNDVVNLIGTLVAAAIAFVLTAIHR